MSREARLRGMFGMNVGDLPPKTFSKLFVDPGSDCRKAGINKINNSQELSHPSDGTKQPPRGKIDSQKRPDNWEGGDKPYDSSEFGYD